MSMSKNKDKDDTQQNAEVDELFRTMMARAKYAGISYAPGVDTNTTAGKLKIIEELRLYVGD